MKRIALYIRVSTEEQAQVKEGSLKSQEQRLREYVDRRNEGGSWGRVSATFIEEGRSGKDMSRPELQKMLLGIQNHLFDVVMVTEISRLSRSTRDFCNMLETFKLQQCQILSIREQFDTTTASGEMMMNMLMNFAQFERQQTAERISANFRARARRGLYNGGAAPLGFTFDPDHKGRLKILDDEAMTVRECYSTFLKEGTLSSCAKSLNQRGFTPKRIRIGGGKHRTGLAHFMVHTLHRILTNPANIGKREILDNGKTTLVKAQWNGIIDEKIFLEVKERLSLNKDRFKPDTYKKYPYLLSGLLTCGLCGQTLVGKSAWGRNGKHLYYAHSSQIRRNHATENPGCHCPIGSTKALLLEKEVLNRFKTLIEKPDIVTSFIDQAKLSQKSNQVKEKMGEQKILIEKTEGKIQTIVNHLESIPSNQAQSLYERLSLLEEQKSKLKEHLNRLHTEMISQIEIIEPDLYIEYIKILMTNIAHAPSHIQKELLKRIVNKIVVFKKDVEVYHYVGKDKILSGPNNETLHFAQGDNQKKYFPGSNTLTSNGGAGTRTPDAADMNRLLYQLSYTASIYLPN